MPTSTDHADHPAHPPKISKRYQTRYSHTSKFGHIYYRITQADFNTINEFVRFKGPKFQSPTHEHNGHHYLKTKTDPILGNAPLTNATHPKIVSTEFKFKPWSYMDKVGITGYIGEIEIDETLDRKNDPVLEFRWVDEEF